MEYNKEGYESTINKLQKLVNDLKDVYKDRIEEKEEITEYENDIKERMILLIESERKGDEETDTLIEEASDGLNRLSKLKEQIEIKRHKERYFVYEDYDNQIEYYPD